MKMNDTMETLRPFIPAVFARKPRGFKNLRLWKATEYRQFLLYTSQFVLKDVLPQDFYDNYMHFSVAICIMVDPTLAKDHLQLAHNFLHKFVEESRKHYGDEFVIYCVHSFDLIE